MSDIFCFIHFWLYLPEVIYLNIIELHRKRAQRKSNRKTMLDYILELNLLPCPEHIKNYVNLKEAKILHFIYEGYIQNPQQLIVMIPAFAR